MALRPNRHGQDRCLRVAHHPSPDAFASHPGGHGPAKPAHHAAPAHHGQRTHQNPRHQQGPDRKIRSLILAPTRELAAQIAESFRSYGKQAHLKLAVVFGGVNQNPQTRALREGVDILIATPGRLMDLMGQGYVDLTGVEVFVLDEADRMLDMGFIPDIRKIVAKLPASPQRQTLLFSATMPRDIRELSASILRNPVSVEVAAESATADRIDQAVYFVERRNKSRLMIHLLENESFTRVLVFTRTKHGADKVVRQLFLAGITSEAIHGNKSQGARTRTMGNFKSGKTPVLIASDIAARGIDIDDISHVINYDLPNVPETYVHRIGRTARAGASGIAISFCDHDERGLLRDIERLTRVPIPVRNDHPVYPPNQEQSTRPPMRPQGPSGRPSQRHAGQGSQGAHSHTGHAHVGGGVRPQTAGAGSAGGAGAPSGGHAGNAGHNKSKPAHPRGSGPSQGGQHHTSHAAGGGRPSFRGRPRHR